MHSPGTKHTYIPLPFRCIPWYFAPTSIHSPGISILLLSSDILHPIPCIPVHSPGTYYTYLYITLAFPCFPWHRGLTSIRPPGIPLHSLSKLNYLAYIVQAFPGTLLALWTHLHTFQWHSPAFPWYISTSRLNSPGFPFFPLELCTRIDYPGIPLYFPAYCWHIARTPLHFPGIPLHSTGTYLLHNVLVAFSFIPLYSSATKRRHHTPQNAYRNGKYIRRKACFAE